MRKQTFTFNPENWVEAELTIVVTQFAGRYEFKMNEEYTITLENLRTFDGFKMWDILIDGKDHGDRVGKSEDDQLWEAIDDIGELSRQDKHPAVAAAKFLAMTM